MTCLITSIPNEMQIEIVKYLDLIPYLNLGLVNRYFHFFLYQKLWETKLQWTYPLIYSSIAGMLLLDIILYDCIIEMVLMGLDCEQWDFYSVSGRSLFYVLGSDFEGKEDGEVGVALGSFLKFFDQNAIDFAKISCFILRRLCFREYGSFILFLLIEQMIRSKIKNILQIMPEYQLLLDLLKKTLMIMKLYTILSRL